MSPTWVLQPAVPAGVLFPGSAVPNLESTTWGPQAGVPNLGCKLDDNNDYMGASILDHYNGLI